MLAAGFQKRHSSWKTHSVLCRKSNYSWSQFSTLCEQNVLEQTSQNKGQIRLQVQRERERRMTLQSDSQTTSKMT